MRGDVRSRRIAVVPDGLLNPAPGDDTALLANLEQEGWGIVALCPSGLVPAAKDAWLDAIVEQVVTFLDDGYEVALVTGDPGAEEFVEALAVTGRSVTRTVTSVRAP
jgi:hypothetical protein